MIKLTSYSRKRQAMHSDRHSAFLRTKKSDREALGHTHSFIVKLHIRSSKKWVNFEGPGVSLCARFVDRNNSIIHCVSSISTPFPNSMSMRIVGLLTRNRLQKFNDRYVAENAWRSRYSFVLANHVARFVQNDWINLLNTLLDNYINV